MFALGFGALLLLLALSRSPSSSVSGPGPDNSPTLNELRRRALDIIAEVVPSQYGDPRFARLGWEVKPGSTATSCGSLPGFMGVHLGDPTGITRWGVEGAREQGMLKGAWVVSNGKRRPSPGDIFGTARSTDGILQHVGVLRRRFTDEAGREIWETADAGQGETDHPRAAYVLRVYDPATNTLARLDNGEPRYVHGWIDLDAWPFPHAKSFAPIDLWRYQDAPPIDGAERDGRLAA